VLRQEEGPGGGRGKDAKKKVTVVEASLAAKAGVCVIAGFTAASVAVEAGVCEETVLASASVAVEAGVCVATGSTSAPVAVGAWGPWGDA